MKSLELQSTHIEHLNLSFLHFSSTFSIYQQIRHHKDTNSNTLNNQAKSKYILHFGCSLCPLAEAKGEALKRIKLVEIFTSTITSLFVTRAGNFKTTRHILLVSVTDLITGSLS